MAIFGPLTLAVLIVPMIASKDENNHLDQTDAFWRWFWLCLFGTATLLSFLRYRRLGKHLASGDMDAILRNPTGGVPKAIGQPFFILIGLVSVPLLALAGYGLGLQVHSSFFDPSSPDTVEVWSGAFIGFCVGCCFAAGFWDYCENSLCPKCRRYFVSAVIGT